MRHLDSLDTQFLAVEDGRNHTHVVAVSVYDPSTAPGGTNSKGMPLISGRQATRRRVSGLSGKMTTKPGTDRSDEDC
jgi:hypothetical protein